MSCEKCCFNPCDGTTRCHEGTFFIRDRFGKIVEMVEIPERLKPIISEAVLKTLESKI